MKISRGYLHVAVVIVAMTLLVGSPLGNTVSAKPLKIRVGSVKVPSELMPVMFTNRKILKNYGKSYTIDFLGFRGTGAMIPALAAKELDLATLAFNSFATAVTNAGLDLKIYADNFQDGVPGYYTSQWGVLEGSGINSIKDLRGKRFAVPAVNTAVDMGMRTVMKRAGMEAGKDYSVVEVRFPNMEAFLREKKIDVAFFAQAFWARAQAKGGIKQIFQMTDALGRTQFVLRIGRREFLEKNREAVIDYMEDYIRALRFHLDPKNRQESVQMVSKYYKLPARAITQWLLVPNKDYYRDPNATINVEALQRNLNTMFELKFTKKALKVSDYWDSSYVDAALRRIGKR